MADKCWEKWLRISLISLTISMTVTDFTTECQRPCDCRWQSGNKAAICSNSSLKVVPANLSSDIQILDLSNNNLLQLHQEAFKRVGLSNLKKLFLRDCSLESIHKSAFATLAIMIELDISKNKIRYLHPDTFRSTEKLRLINLNNNLIDKLEDGLFRNLKYLQKVEVSNNRIVRIGTKAFVNLPQLKILRIDGNNLSHMKPETLMALRNLSGLDLHNNPWRCDCNLQTFRDWVISHNLYTPPTSCAEPAAIRSKLWNELDSSNFACRPTILEPLPDSTFKSYDENVTLICKVVGNPTPEVIWKFNGRTIELRSFGEIRYVVADNTLDLIRWVNLTILHARYTDRGNYTCVAENPGGADEKTLTLVLSKYSGAGTIAGMEADSFAIMVGSVTAIIIIFGAVITLCHCTSNSSEMKRLIKTDTRSSNGDVLIEGSVASEPEKLVKSEIVCKANKKYDATLTSQATEMSELNKTLLDSDTVLAIEENHRHEELPIHKELLIDRIAKDPQTYPPDLLSIPLRSTAQSSSSASHDRQSPKSPNYDVISISPALYSRLQAANIFMSPKGYVTLPRRLPYESDLRPFSTLNGVIPYYENFNTKIFGGTYYSLNKSDMDIGPVKMRFEEEPAPSPAPGTPHATIPRNSVSSPNIHNQLLVSQRAEKTLKINLENEVLKDRVRANIVGASLRTSGHRKRNSCDLNNYLAVDNATQV
ncbi:leucine-rich repeat, immunoglobulin-like domain and transmembrane domain-containing protein 2 [Pieris rapae]|uniref:leucine-rich repeat, immunoglobulin-like domain and transmembrane domain-containing protein 2 n=1 Tax=Pieris rapae TaxID=64459 RepID=UPI000B928357|nr:leucine-rich repeat, immunoglobulin-like domain and transmembrane domain-containing protein 2 [Pieris rapae]